MPVPPVTCNLSRFQPEDVCPCARDANRGSTMSSTSRPSAVTGTASASGLCNTSPPPSRPGMSTRVFKGQVMGASSSATRWMSVELKTISPWQGWVTGKKINPPSAAIFLPVSLPPLLLHHPFCCPMERLMDIKIKIGIINNHVQ